MAQELPYTNRSAQEIEAAAKSQWRYTDSGEAAQDGSVAIALGRSAGYALMLGDKAKAEQYWEQLNALEPTQPGARTVNVPTPDQLLEGTQKANAESFELFNNETKFPRTAGMGLANAMGSLAYAVDYLRRGEEVSEAGPSVLIDGANALRAMGFEKQANVWDELRAREEAKKSNDKPKG